MARAGLSSVFNRGFWDGYYLGQKLGEWSDVYGSKATFTKTYVAKNLNYFAKAGIGEFLCEAGSLKQGDKILIIGPTTGVIEQEIGITGESESNRESSCRRKIFHACRKEGPPCR